jgi:hypothetical protein
VDSTLFQERIMKCKLCGNNKKLLKKSHIVPDFMYQNLFDEKHRIFEVLLKQDSQLKKNQGSQADMIKIYFAVNVITRYWEV